MAPRLGPIIYRGLGSPAWAKTWAKFGVLKDDFQANLLPLPASNISECVA